MFDKKLFKIALIKKDKSMEEIAMILNIDISTLYRKVNGESDFYRYEVQAICDYLEIEQSERELIFFAQEIA